MRLGIVFCSTRQVQNSCLRRKNSETWNCLLLYTASSEQMSQKKKTVRLGIVFCSIRQVQNSCLRRKNSETWNCVLLYTASSEQLSKKKKQWDLELCSALHGKFRTAVLEEKTAILGIVFCSTRQVQNSCLRIKNSETWNCVLLYTASTEQLS